MVSRAGENARMLCTPTCLFLGRLEVLGVVTVHRSVGAGESEE